MAVLVLIALALCAGSAQAVFRIVGGEPTTIDEYPYVVQVDYMGVSTGIWGQSCAANILTSTFVLSAAHCFHGINYDPRNRRVRAGTTYRNTDGILAYVLVEFNHPTYGMNGNDGDISIVKLIDQLVYSPQVAQGTFVSEGVTLPDNLPVIHVGWGATSQGGSASPELLETTIFTVNKDFCRDLYASLSIPEVVTENMICAGLLDVGGRSACQGDSGGPLYYNDPVLGNIVVGIVSWGYGCANDTFPGVNTAVSPYINWVIDTAV